MVDKEPFKSFNKQKQELRQTYKRYKAGLIKEEQLDDETKRLLRKYYGL